MRIAWRGFRRVWWVPVLARGKLHVDLLPDAFPGDRPEGAQAFVQQVHYALGRRFQAGARPTVLLTDRGAGFYNPGSGVITKQYKESLANTGFTAFMGERAAAQPGKLSDCLLHETAVSWIRMQERKTLPRRPWLETNVQFSRRLKGIVAKINNTYDVAGLCRELPGRVDQIFVKAGGKLKR